jgi:iron complex outermembrane receptor protein
MTGSKRLRLALLSACCIAAWPGSAVAQEATDKSTDDIIVRADRAVVGTKTDTKLIEIPQSISVVTAEEFTDRASVNFQDVFRYSAGITTEQNGVDTRGDFFAARGFPTVQYLDGLNRMPSFVYGARLDIFTVERAEVLRGPSAVLYGAGGAGGLFNATTKRPKQDFGGEIGVLFGTDKRKELQVDVTGGLTDTIAARFVGVARDGELQIPGQRNDRLLAMPVISFTPDDNTTITLIGLYQKDNLGTQSYLPITKSAKAVTRAEKIPFDFFAGEPGFNHMDTEYYTGSVLIDHRFSDSISFSSRTRYFHQDVDYAEIYGDNAYADAARTKVYREFYVDKEWYQGVNSDNSLLAKFKTGPFSHQFLIGVDYTNFYQDRKEGFSCLGWTGAPCYAGGSPPPLDIYNPQYGASFDYGFTNFVKNKNTQLGLYLQDQIRFADRVSLILGLRRDRATSESNGVKLAPNTAWTFRAGIIGEITAGISPYFSYSESFLPVFGTNVYGVPFVPRTGRQYETGIKWQPTRGALVTVSLFDIKESNFVTSDPNNIQNFLQTGSVGSRGVEVEATLRMPGDLDLTAAYSYTRAKVLSDKPASDPTTRNGFRLDNLPEHQASLWVSKSFNLSTQVSAKVGAGVRYMGDKIDYYQNYVTPAVTLADAMASIDYGKWSLSINGSNIFGTEYYTNCNFSPLDTEGACYAGTARTILASLRRRF